MYGLLGSARLITPKNGEGASFEKAAAHAFSYIIDSTIGDRNLAQQHTIWVPHVNA